MLVLYIFVYFTPVTSIVCVGLGGTHFRFKRGGTDDHEANDPTIVSCCCN